MKKATITITPDQNPACDITTGGVTNLELLDAFKTLSKHFAQELVKEYKEARGITRHVDIDDKDFEDYIKFLRTEGL